MEAKESAVLGQFGDVGEAAIHSMTDGMVHRIGMMVEQLGSAADLLATPEFLALLSQARKSAPALTHMLARVDELNQTGALDTLLDLASVVHSARQSMSDGMVHKIGETARAGLELADLALSSGIAEKAPGLMAVASEARASAAADTSRIGPFALLSALKEPEMQFMLKFMLHLARRMPKAL